MMASMVKRTVLLTLLTLNITGVTFAADTDSTKHWGSCSKRNTW